MGSSPAPSFAPAGFRGILLVMAVLLSVAYIGTLLGRSSLLVIVPIRRGKRRLETGIIEWLRRGAGRTPGRGGNYDCRWHGLILELTGVIGDREETTNLVDF